VEQETIIGLSLGLVFGGF